MSSVEQILAALRRAPPKGGAAPSAVIDRVQEWKGMGESMVISLANSLSDIESREEKLKLATESLEAQWRDLKEKERQLEVLDEGRRKALEFMEDKLKAKGEKLDEREENLKAKGEELDERKVELKAKDEKLDEQLKDVHEELERLEVKQEEAFCMRLKQCEKLREIEKREKEFHAYHDEKMRELALKEEFLVKRETEFAEMCEGIQEKQKASTAVIEKLVLAQNVVSRMKVNLDDKFKEMRSWEMTAHKSLSAKLNEADLIRESLEKRFKELEDIEMKLNFSQDDETKILESNEGQVGTVRIEEDEEKKRELELKQLEVACKMEHGNEERDCGEKSLSTERDSAQTCAKEKLVPTNLDHHPREAELKQRPQEVEQPTSITNARLSTNQGKAIDLTILKDVMTLAMVINGPEKDLELMGSEIHKILSLSSDPAKVVLKTVEAFYADCSEMVVKECKERRRTNLMLDQLAILSPDIQPCVTEAAVKLAREWKSIMSSTSKHPMEILVFLNLVAAYKLSSHFNENELFNLLMAAAKHKQTPVLCHTLGLVHRIPGYINKLINEKRYLPASTFIYEYQLQDRFPQAAILNQFISHARSLANAKCGSQHNSPEAKKRAIATEIAALRAALKHISHYGLESDFSPNPIPSRIKQLEATQANLRRKIPTPSSEIQKQGKGGRAWRRKRKAELLQAFRNEGRESASFLQNPQMSVSRYGPNSLSSSPASTWTPPKHQVMSQAETDGYSNCRLRAYSVRMAPDVGPYKRSRVNLWRNDDALHVPQFATSQQY